MSETIAILLVEDNEDDVEIIRRLVRRSGAEHRLELAATGKAAIELARVQAFDIALVDQHLPDIRGEQLIGQLHEAAPELPVVMLTRQGDERLAVEVMKAGAYDYLRKDDLDPAILRRTLNNVVDRARLKLEVQRANERLRDWAIRDGLTGLFLAYLYFSLPRAIASYTAAAQAMDLQLEEAARSLGASRWRILRDVWVPALTPTTLACGAIVFATAMGAFGTAFTLASKFEVLPITIYNEFTNYANFALAASLSIALGLMTWVVLFLARRLGGNAVGAGA